MNKRRAAFTLAEVLITIAIIGIVAVFTIPALIHKYQEKVFTYKLQQAHNLFSNALDLAQEEYGELYSWGSTTTAKEQTDKYFERITRFLKLAQDCNQGLCGMYSKYTNLRGTDITGASTGPNCMKIHTGMLQNGMIFSICAVSIDNKKWWGNYGHIAVDVNGSAGPNSKGVDLFLFRISDDSSNWVDNKKPKINPEGSFANYTNTECLSGKNGAYCTEWVIKYKNMDYLHCRNKLYNTNKHSCKE